MTPTTKNCQVHCTHSMNARERERKRERERESDSLKTDYSPCISFLLLRVTLPVTLQFLFIPLFRLSRQFFSLAMVSDLFDGFVAVFCKLAS